MNLFFSLKESVLHQAVPCRQSLVVAHHAAGLGPNNFDELLDPHHLAFAFTDDPAMLLCFHFGSIFVCSCVTADGLHSFFRLFVTADGPHSFIQLFVSAKGPLSFVPVFEFRTYRCTATSRNKHLSFSYYLDADEAWSVAEALCLVRNLILFIMICINPNRP